MLSSDINASTFKVIGATGDFSLPVLNREAQLHAKNMVDFPPCIKTKQMLIRFSIWHCIRMMYAITEETINLEPNNLDCSHNSQYNNLDLDK